MNGIRMSIPEVLANYDMVDYVATITTVKKISNEFECLCLFHDDSKPSMRMYNKNGRQLFKCFVCSQGGDTLDLVKKYNNFDTNREAIDHLTGRRDSTPRVIKKVVIKSTDNYSDFEPLPLPDFKPVVNQWLTVFNPKNTEKPLWKMCPTAIYEYETGYVFRLDFRDGSKNTPTVRFCKQLSTGMVGWVAYKFDDENRTHFGEIKPTGSVLVFEGEKTTRCAIEIFNGNANVSAIGWSGGTNAVMRTNWSVLDGRNVVLVPDADYPGFKAMLELHDKIGGARLIDPTDQKKGFDIADRPFNESQLFDWLTSRMVSREEFEEKTRVMEIAHKRKLTNKQDNK